MSSAFNKGKLFRDLDNAVISGVCAGAANQVSVDPIWVRLAAVFGLFCAPTVFLLGYLLAVILVPKA